MNKKLCFCCYLLMAMGNLYGLRDNLIVRMCMRVEHQLINKKLTVVQGLRAPPRVIVYIMWEKNIDIVLAC